MAVRDFGEIYAIGTIDLTINAEMFINEDTWDTPASVRLPSSGTYTGCSKVNTYVLSIDNPSSDSTFSFPIEYSENDIDWYTSQITGTVYKSLGSTNISFTLVRTTISESTWSLSGLCTSSNVNQYSPYKPNGSSPYKLGDFRWYTHGALGGTYVTYWKPTGNIAWGDTFTVKGIGSKRWIEIPGKPFATSRVAIYEDSTLRSNTEVDFDTTYGALTSYTSEARTPASETNYNMYAKTQHYYSGSWVDGTTQAFTVTQDGKPWSISVDSGYPNAFYDEFRIQFDYVGPDALKARFTAQDSGSGPTYVDEVIYGDTNDVYMSVYTTGADWVSPVTWSLEIEYPFDSGVWYTEASGNKTW